MKREDFLKALEKPIKRGVIYVPELGEGAKFYATPLTPRDEIEVDKLISEMDLEPHEIDVYKGLAHLIVKAEDEDGEKLLSSAHFPILLDKGSAFIGRIVTEMSEGSFVDQVEDEKKS
jgi:hypothetical protein